MKLCPTCHRPIEAGPRRVCFRCKQPIRRHDRWHFDGGRCVHNDCEAPAGEPQVAPLLEQEETNQ